MFKVSRSLPSWIQTDHQKSCNRQRTFCSRAPEDQGFWHDFCCPTMDAEMGETMGNLEIFIANVIKPSSLHTFRHLFGACSMAIECFFMGFYCTWWMFCQMGSWEKDLPTQFPQDNLNESTGCYCVEWRPHLKMSWMCLLHQSQHLKKERSTNSLKNVKRYDVTSLTRPQVEKDRNY